jgi:hypothetical protein
MKTLFGILFCLICLIAGWLTVGWLFFSSSKISSSNVSAQWKFAYQYSESLKTIARQACVADQAVSQSEGGEERTQRRSQALAVKQNYARVQAEYDAAVKNAFEAKYVRPADVTAEAPSLVQMQMRVCGQ